MFRFKPSFHILKRSLGFIEIKSRKYNKNQVKVNKALNRLIVFNRNAIESNKLTGTLATNIVGKLKKKVIISDFLFRKGKI